MTFDPTKPAMTKSGKNAFFIGNYEEAYPLEFKIDGERYFFNLNGKLWSNQDNILDLINIEEPMAEETKCKYCSDETSREKDLHSDCCSDCSENHLGGKDWPIDWSKPIQAVSLLDGQIQKARIIDFSIENNHFKRLVAFFHNNPHGESVSQCDEDGCIPGYTLKIQNIPAQPQLEFVVGGVYKTRSNTVCVICTIRKETCKYPLVGCVFKSDFISYASWEVDGKFNSDYKEHELDLIEKLGDIRDLNSIIAEALK